MLLQCGIPRSACVRLPMSFWPIWTRKRLILAQITTGARKNPSFFLQKYLICSLTVVQVSRWVWRPIFLPITWMRWLQPAYMSFTTQIAQLMSWSRSFLRLISRPLGLFMAFKVFVKAIALAEVVSWCVPKLTLRSLIKARVRPSSLMSCHTR